LLEQTDQGEPAGSSENPIPGEHWPDLHTIDYVTKLLVLILLILGLPWLLGRVFTNPTATPEHAAAFAGGAVPKAA
jgi:flagellar biogenesis protein FliO